MSEHDDNRLLEFPCEFPVKVMGRSSEHFEAEMLRIFEHHIDDMNAAKVTSRPSASGNFTSLTVVFRARSQEQLDALYRDLTDHDAVLFCL